MINIEKELIVWLNAHPVDGLNAFADVPKDRPARFVTVERVGGATDRIIDRPLASVQVWGKSRTDASDTALLVREALSGFVIGHQSVAGLSIQSVVNNPDPDSGQARYQITVSFVTV